MSKKTQMEQMVLGMYAVVDTNNWLAMEAANREVTGLLSDLAAKGKLAADTLPALAELHRAHLHAQEHCARELEKVGKHLEELRDRKEGWLAYALNSDTGEAEA